MLEPANVCCNQVTAFFRDLDENRYDDLVGRLAPDGAWHRQGKVLQGREAVLSALAARSPTMRIHHLLCNLMIDEATEARVTLRAYMLVVRHDSGQSLAGPAPLSGIENIRTIHVDMARHGDDWLIARLRNDEPSFAAQA